MTAAVAERSPSWRADARTTRGASHQRTGTPNQDFGKAALLEGKTGVVLAVADGHGSALHARSERGSRFAVEISTTILGDFIRYAPAKQVEIRAAAAELPRRIVEAWRARVRADLAIDPPTPSDLALDETIHASPEILYGSTLVSAAIDQRLAIYVQIGDGDLLAIGADDSIRRVLPGDDDIPLNMTESLCQTDANLRFRHAVDFFSDRVRPALLMLSTDGYRNSFAGEESFLKVGRDLKRYIEANGFDWVAQHLEAWLEETTRHGSGDDITLALGWLGCEPRRGGKLRRSVLWKVVAAIVLVLLLSGGLSAWTFAPAAWKARMAELLAGARAQISRLMTPADKPAPTKTAPDKPEIDAVPDTESRREPVGAPEGSSPAGRGRKAPSWTKAEE